MKAMAFDLDGVLIDSVAWHYEAFNRALQVFGYSVSPELHALQLNGLPTVKKLEILGISPALRPPIQALKKRYTDLIVRERCRPDYQKMMLLNSLYGKYRLACVSNAHRESTLQMLKLARLDKFFYTIVGGDQGKPKPSPDLYQLAFKFMGVSPKECLVIEDALPGIEAGKAAGALVYRTEYALFNSRSFEAWL